MEDVALQIHNYPTFPFPVSPILPTHKLPYSAEIVMVTDPVLTFRLPVAYSC